MASAHASSSILNRAASFASASASRALPRASASSLATLARSRTSLKRSVRSATVIPAIGSALLALGLAPDRLLVVALDHGPHDGVEVLEEVHPADRRHDPGLPGDI